MSSTCTEGTRHDQTAKYGTCHVCSTWIYCVRDVLAVYLPSLSPRPPFLSALSSVMLGLGVYKPHFRGSLVSCQVLLVGGTIKRLKVGHSKWSTWFLSPVPASPQQWDLAPASIFCQNTENQPVPPAPSLTYMTSSWAVVPLGGLSTDLLGALLRFLGLVICPGALQLLPKIIPFHSSSPPIPM